MENTKMDYTKRLEELEEGQSRINRKINEARAAIRFENVGNLETHYLNQCRKSRKEIRERIAAQEASNEPGTVELA